MNVSGKVHALTALLPRKHLGTDLSEAEWAPELVCVFLRRDTSLAFARIRTLDYQA